MEVKIFWHAKILYRDLHTRRMVVTSQLNVKEGTLIPYREMDLTVVYFDQLLGAVRTLKLVELLSFSRFQPILFILNLFQ